MLTIARVPQYISLSLSLSRMRASQTKRPPRVEASTSKRLMRGGKHATLRNKHSYRIFPRCRPVGQGDGGRNRLPLVSSS